MIQLPEMTSSTSPDCPDVSPSDAMNRMILLEQEIRAHNDLYYKSLRPTISDAQYDLLLADCFCRRRQNPTAM